MAKKLKNPDPHRMQVIAWKDGAKKEIVMRCLNDPAVTKEMPKDIIGNAGAMVLWGARRLRDLAKAGQLREQVAPMFSNKPEEVKELESRIANLERSLYLCQTAVKAAAHKMRQPGFNPKTVIDECLLSVSANSPKFMGAPVPEPEEEG